MPKNYACKAGYDVLRLFFNTGESLPTKKKQIATKKN